MLCQLLVVLIKRELKMQPVMLLVTMEWLTISNPTICNMLLELLKQEEERKYLFLSKTKLLLMKIVYLRAFINLLSNENNKLFHAFSIIILFNNCFKIIYK
jgi:hypothetical protein